MEEELVSIIVPIYNIEDYLPRCLACIEMQTYRNLEIILVNDGSTDGSGRICDEFAAKDSRMRVIHHPENIGLWAARNTGQDAAHGDYLWFPDGDDYFHKDIIKVMHEAINQKSSSGKKYDLAIVGYSKTERMNENVTSKIIPTFMEKSLEELWGYYSYPIEGFSVFSMWGKFCRRELMKDIRSENYKYAQDRDVSIKILLKEPQVIGIIDGYYFWLQRDTSAIHSLDYRSIRSRCETQLIYNNLLRLRGDNGKYLKFHRFLLEALYINMASYLDNYRVTSEKTLVRKKCRTIICNTWRDYLKCREIKTLKRRLMILFRVRFNGLYSLLS